MGADEHRQHAFGFVSFDETHATHVGGEVVDHARTLGGGAALLEQGEIAHMVLDAWSLLVPLVERFKVDSADISVATLLQNVNEMAADEAAGPGNDYKIIFGY